MLYGYMLVVLYYLKIKNVVFHKVVDLWKILAGVSDYQFVGEYIQVPHHTDVHYQQDSRHKLEVAVGSHAYFQLELLMILLGLISLCCQSR